MMKATLPVALLLLAGCVTVATPQPATRRGVEASRRDGAQPLSDFDRRLNEMADEEYLRTHAWYGGRQIAGDGLDLVTLVRAVLSPLKWFVDELTAPPKPLEKPIDRKQ